MAEPLLQTEHDPDAPQWPDVSHLTTENDEPVDNMFQDKQADILVEALRVSWEKGRPFLSAADVGVFPVPKDPAIVPDFLLAVGVDRPEDRVDEQRSYFVWAFGKPPDVVIEIVSNTKRGEDTTKLAQYAAIRVPYYVIYDPDEHLSSRRLRIFQMSGASYVEKVDRAFPELGLGLTVWEGSFDNWKATWLRWVDAEGQILATGEEVRKLADQEAERANREAERANQEAERADKLAARLRELGLDPSEI